MSPLSPPPPHNTKSIKLDYYYFVIGLSLVAILLLLTNAFAIGFCSWFRHLVVSRGSVPHDLADHDILRFMPTYTHIKKKEEDQEEQDGGCAVCISEFEEGEQIRRMSQCGHSFHANCIDMWLSSHNSCPVCREIVLPASFPSVDMSSELSTFASREFLLPGSATRPALPV